MKTRGSSSMAGVLAAAVILVLLVVVFMYGGFGPQTGVTKLGGETLTPRADQKGITVPGAVRYRALDDVCRSNLQQVRMALQIAQTSSPESQSPASLNDLKGLDPDMLKCSIEPHEPYNYDPATGKVTCPHPGHEKY